MKKEDKSALMQSLAEDLKAYSHFYVVDVEGLNAEMTSKLRRACFEKEIKLMVVKNSFLKHVLASLSDEYAELNPSLKGSTALMFSNVGNAPAKLIKEFGAANGKPELKSAYVEQSVYVGAQQLDALVAIKSKEELIADIIALLQSPVKNVVSGLQGSAGNKIHGILETLSNK